MTNDFGDQSILRLYEEFSLTVYAAGFMIGDDVHVWRFRQWLKERPPFVIEDYEAEMLAEYRSQEAAEGC